LVVVEKEKGRRPIIASLFFRKKTKNKNSSAAPASVTKKGRENGDLEPSVTYM
jgi:hypothetical protein